MFKYLICLSFMLISICGFSQSASARLKNYNLDDKVAIQGYDPVAYFVQKKAIKGKKEIAYSHEGVFYYFSSPENKTSFVKSPSSYEPQYGGWCAFAMGDSGKKVSVDPKTYKIVNGKLYLFYNAYFNNTLKTWNKDESRLMEKSDKNWAKLIAQ